MLIGIGCQTVMCRVSVVPRLDCTVLKGRDCPMLVQLLWQSGPSIQTGVQPEMQAELDGIELPLQRTDLARLTRDDASLRFAILNALPEPPAFTETTPRFTMDDSILYRSQLVVPMPLCQRLPYLAHII